MSEVTETERGTKYALFCELENLIDHNINVRMLGNLMFSGKLNKVFKHLICLRDVTVICSGGLSLSTFDLEQVSLSLDDVTSVGQPAGIYPKP